jgi:hypothetical protein
VQLFHHADIGGLPLVSGKCNTSRPPITEQLKVISPEEDWVRSGSLKNFEGQLKFKDIL